MRVQRRKIYKASELKGAAFQRALADYQAEQMERGPAWSKEIFFSLKRLFDHCTGVTLADYDLGVYTPSGGLTIQFANGPAAQLTGRRAMAWLENNLIGRLRMPWTGQKRWELAKYGEAYRPGLVPPCPFTGDCVDEDYLDALRKAVNGGATLQRAFEGLADVYRRIHETEDEYEQSEDYFRDQAEANDWEYDRNGARI